MKHILVIETVGPDHGGKKMSELDQEILTRTVELFLDTEGRVGFVQSRFNVSSAIAAVHEMYGAPAWDPNDILSQGPKPELPRCEWYGRYLGEHHWVDTADGYKICDNCKIILLREKANDSH